MGFESFTVTLRPCSGSLLCYHADFTLQTLSAQIQQQCPPMRVDSRQREEAEVEEDQPEAEFLFSDTPAGLYQLRLDQWRNGEQSISVRFALCNPRSIDLPFCQMVAWLMQQYHLRCTAFTTMTQEDTDFCDPQQVFDQLLPLIAEQRQLWWADAGTVQETCCRPGDAIERFILPRLVVT